MNTKTNLLASVAFSLLAASSSVSHAQEDERVLDANLESIMAEIEDEILQWRKHIEHLEAQPLPEGSKGAVEAEIRMLQQNSSISARQEISEIVRRAATMWVMTSGDTNDFFTAEPEPFPDQVPSNETPESENAESPAPKSTNLQDLNGLDLPPPVDHPGRVLTLPGAAKVYQGQKEELPAFTVMYSHKTVEVDGRQYLAVSSNRDKVDGWLPLESTEDWKSMLVMQYAPRSGRQRVVFFNDKDDVQEVLNSHWTGPEEARALYRQVEAGQFDNSKIVAIEPETVIEGDKRPYFMPILGYERSRFEDVSNTPVFLLELGAVNLLSKGRSDTDPVGANKTSIDVEGAVQDLKIGMVFVVDATTSMQPYIDEVQSFLRNMRKQASEIAPGKIDFGLFGYRDNMSPNKSIEYVTKSFLPLSPLSEEDFEAAVDGIKAANVSTKDWREDAFAGLQDAIELTDWTGYDARFVVLVSDAGPRTIGDSLARDGMLGARSIGRMAERRNVSLTIMHMMTGAGLPDHMHARSQYNEVAQALGDAAPRYFSLTGDTPETFGVAMDSVGNKILQQIKAINQGQAARRTYGFGDDPLIIDLMGSEAVIEDKADAEAVGNVFADQIFAFQQEYLGKLEGGEAPDFYRAWVADRDLAHPNVNSMQVKVLISRDEMSDLSSRLGTIVERLNLKEKGTQDAFREIADLAGVAAYDPNLSVSDLLPEYLADLPYGSRFMTMTSEVWNSLGGPQQDELLNEVRDRIQVLETINSSAANWLLLPGRSEGNELYPLALDDLP